MKTGGWLRSVVIIVVVDIAIPLGIYNGLRAAGLSTISALLLSGVFPALSVLFGAIRHRRLEVVGALVLAGIVVGSVLGLIFHSARLVLVEGSVPTAVFGITCLGSLTRERPLMYDLAMEFMGADSARGREMAGLWQYEPFRRIWRIITTVWGGAFLLEAALRVVIIYTTSIGTAMAISKFTPFVFFGLLCAWTMGYGQYRKRKGEREAAAAAAASGEVAASGEASQ